MLTSAIVTNADRDWALAQKPAWAVMSRDEPDDEGDSEITDDVADCASAPNKREPTWFDFVVGEIESFERYYPPHETKTYADWSYLWRNSWWPKRREDWAFKNAPKVLHPFFKRGSEEFDRALTVATNDEKRLWQQFGVAQFKPDDPRLTQVCCR